MPNSTLSRCAVLTSYATRCRHCFVVQTTTRVLGGLLSAHHHSGGDALYLKRARDLADRILPAFDTPSGLPLSMVNLQRRKGVLSKDNGGLVTTAEVSALQLEFRYLSELTGDDTYWKAAERVRFRLTGEMQLCE